MPAPVLEEINHAAEALAEKVASARPGSRALWQITGPPAVGKSECLKRTAALLRGHESLVPVLVSPSPHQLDVASVAITEAAVGLAEGGAINGELGGWSTPGAFAARINDLRTWIDDHADRVVLLLDAPRSWGGENAEDTFFSTRARDTALTLALSPCRRVVAGRSNIVTPPIEKITLDEPAPESDWLEDLGEWGKLGPSVEALRESALFYRAKTPLSVRLLVAAIAVSSVAEVEAWLPEGDRAFDADALVAPVAELMRERAYGAWQEWQRFSLTRRSFDPEVFERLLGDRTDQFTRDLTRHCLLYGDESLRMHEALKLNVRRYEREKGASPSFVRLCEEANATLFEVYRDRFARFSQEASPRALRESVEAYHFASVLGGEDFLSAVAPLFVDQLDALGWSLSYERREYDRAASTFEEAINWDPDDDYAHHYLAYNLYRRERRLPEVERHFRRAVEIAPDHPWWHSRLISFLVDRGRIGAAMEAWEEAELALGLGESDLSPGTYEHLHCWVAISLLDAGEPRLARRILDAVPDWAQEKVDNYPAISRRADALLELGERHAVVPAWRLEPEWWASGPELLQSHIGAGATAKRLMKWLAARVEERDEAGLHLFVALVEGGGEPELARTVLDRENFERFCRDAVAFEQLSTGSFLELGLYAEDETGADAETIVRVLPERAWENARGPARPVEPALAR